MSAIVGTGYDWSIAQICIGPLERPHSISSIMTAALSKRGMVSRFSKPPLGLLKGLNPVSVITTAASWKRGAVS